MYDSFRAFIHIDQASFIRIENNLVYNSAATVMTEPGGGFYKLDEYYANSSYTTPDSVLDFMTSTGHDRVIRNNIFVNATYGIKMGGCEMIAGSSPATRMPCVLNNDVIEKNTVINTGDVALAISEHPLLTNGQIKNNVFDTRSSGQIGTNSSGAGVVFANNIWSKTPRADVRGTGDVVPASRTAFSELFIDPSKILDASVLIAGEVNPNWFRLRSQYQSFGADTSLVGANPTTEPPPTDPPPANPPPTNPPPTKPGDSNGDMDIDIFDYNTVLGAFGQTVTGGVTAGDLNADGSVNVAEVTMVITYFGT